MRKLAATFLLLFSVVIALAQTPADSSRFCHAQEWNVRYQENGITVRELKSKLNAEDTYLFGAPEHIYVMEIPASKYRLQSIQTADKDYTTELQKRLNGVASVNGGFFVVNPPRKGAAVANDFLKINGRVVSPYPTPGWGSGAVAIDNAGALHFALWGKEMDADTVNGWSTGFPNVMVAGPMLILDGAPIPNGDPARHPRTAIGTRPDGTVVLVVIDGRRRRASGATFAEMIALGRWLGLDNMLNLDGGGSSTMVYKRVVVNFPSDGQGIIPLQRKIANAIVVLPK